MKQLQRKNKFCCEEHLDIGFDDFLTEYEIFPHMEEAHKESCNYCDEKAKYILVLPENENVCDE